MNGRLFIIMLEWMFQLIAKDMSTKNAAVRKTLKDYNCHEELIKEMQVLKDKLIQEYDDYERKQLNDIYQVFD